MIKDLTGKFKHIYVSTGATFDDEIKFANNILKEKRENIHSALRNAAPNSARKYEFE